MRELTICLIRRRGLKTLIALLLTINVFVCTANDSETVKRDTTFVVTNDDPILMMIDSLMGIKYFESFGLDLDTSSHENELVELNDSMLELRLNELNRHSPISLDYNQYVKAYINLYAVKRPKVVSNVLGLSAVYYPLFEEVLDKYNMPLELKHLAVVESALSPVAKSRVGAQGLWQFMYRTGKMYGLDVNSYQDDRMDPYKSTVAACEYMSDLYELYGDWHMVLAAYNSGPGNVNKAIRRSGGKRTYWEIRRYLPRETRGYVPAFIAVNYIMNYYKEHHINANVNHSYAFLTDTIQVFKPMTFDQISSYVGLPIEQIRFLNPMYRLDFIPESENGQTLCLPMEKVGLYLANEAAIFADLRRKAVKDSIEGKPQKPVAPPMIVHSVRNGEFLGYIAEKYNVRVSEIMAWNNKSNTRLKLGEKLTIYTDKSVAEVKKVSQPKPVLKDNGKYKVHVVRSGDTLWDIAKLYKDSSVTELKRLNSHINYKRLKPGMEIRIKAIG